MGRDRLQRVEKEVHRDSRRSCKPTSGVQQLRRPQHIDGVENRRRQLGVIPSLWTRRQSAAGRRALRREIVPGVQPAAALVDVWFS